MNHISPVSVGNASKNITIQTPVLLAGHINRDQSAQTFMDYPKIHTLVLRIKDSTTILISLDLLEIATDICNSMRKKLSNQYTIPVSSVIIACTHTHTAPAALSIGSLDPDDALMNTLYTDIVDTVEKASRISILCSMRIGKALAKGFGINRRKIIDGNVVMKPNSEGLIDEELQTIWFTDAHDKVIAAIINFSMHPTTLDVGIFKISADYPEYMRTYINKTFPDCTTLFLNGACGDVRPNLVHKDGGFRGGDIADLEWIGSGLGKKAIETYHNGSQVAHCSLLSLEEHLPLYFNYDINNRFERREPLQNQTEARQIDPRLMQEFTASWAQKTKEKEKLSGRIESLELNISVLALSPTIAIVFLAGEIFVETGLLIKQASPFEHTIIASYSNGTVGYIPTAASIAQGGYEVEDAYRVYHNPAPFESSATDKVVHHSLELLKKLKETL